MSPSPLPRSSRALSIGIRALPALWLALPSSASAQVSCNQPPESGKFIPAPQGISGSYKRIVSGDVSGDWDEEVATIKGNTLILYHGPSRYDATYTAPGAIDLCFAPDSGSGTKGFVYTTSGGLSRVTFDSGSHQYVTGSVSSASLWQNAPIVRWSTGVVGSATGNGLFGVSAVDLKTVFCAPAQAGGISPPTSMFPHGYNILDIAPLNWDSDSQMEIAILDSHGVQVREQDGTLRLNRASQNAGDAIAVVHAAGSTDSLALITRMSGWSKLMLFNQNFTTQGPLAISTGTFHSMTNADIEGDGDDDLVLAASTSNSLLVLYNGVVQQQSPWFSVAQGATGSIDMSMPCDSSVSSGKVLCANLYNQWVDTNWDDNDAVPPRPVPAFALVLPNVDGVDGLRTLPQEQEVPDPPPSLYDFANPRYQGARFLAGPCESGNSADHSNWDLTLGNGWNPTNATEMQVVVRKCEFNTTVPVEQFNLDPFAILPAGSISGKHINFLGAETGNQADNSYDYRYFVEVRPVRRVSGSVVRVWRWSILGLATTCDGTDDLQGLPGGGTPLIYISFDSCDGTPGPCVSSFGANVVPSAVPLSEIPSPGYPGDPPQ